MDAARATWDSQGPETKRALLALLPDDWSFAGKRVLDFGCGTGRTLRHFLPEAETGEFWGADVNAHYVDVARQALAPQMKIFQCDVAPPLTGVDYGSFDLAWAISVFTHLTDVSTSWLLDLHRLLKPGGLLIATYIGRWNSEYAVGEPWDEDRVGKNVVHHTQDWERGGPTVLMSDWWVRAHWGRAFEVVEITPRVHNMSWALLRKRDVELSEGDVDKPADDPREYLALKHNLDQVQRELEFTQAVCDKLVADARHEYESSLSWQLTRPLRATARLARSARRPGRPLTAALAKAARLRSPRRSADPRA